jgi:hypothetical protein
VAVLLWFVISRGICRGLDFLAVCRADFAVAWIPLRRGFRCGADFAAARISLRRGFRYGADFAAAWISLRRGFRCGLQGLDFVAARISLRSDQPTLHGCVEGAKVLDAAVPPVCYESLRCWRLLRRGRILRWELLEHGEWQSRCLDATYRRGTHWLGGGPKLPEGWGQTAAEGADF